MRPHQEEDPGDTELRHSEPKPFRPKNVEFRRHRVRLRVTACKLVIHRVAGLVRLNLTGAWPVSQLRAVLALVPESHQMNLEAAKCGTNTID